MPKSQIVLTRNISIGTHPRNREGDIHITLHPEKGNPQATVYDGYQWHTLLVGFNPAILQTNHDVKPLEGYEQVGIGFLAIYLTYFQGRTVTYEEDLQAYLLPEDAVDWAKEHLHDAFTDFYKAIVPKMLPIVKTPAR